MKTLLQAEVINGYRSHKPVGFYSPLRGHTGVDLKFTFEDFPSPVTGKIIAIHEGPTKQVEMGNVVFLEDLMGTCHVFAHLEKIYKRLGDSITRQDVFAQSGNTGGKSTGPHLHWEIIKPYSGTLINKIMFRKELMSVFRGYNFDPIRYLKDLYFKYQLGFDGKPITNI